MPKDIILRQPLPDHHYYLLLCFKLGYPNNPCITAIVSPIALAKAKMIEVNISKTIRKGASQSINLIGAFFRLSNVDWN